MTIITFTAAFIAASEATVTAAVHFTTSLKHLHSWCDTSRFTFADSYCIGLFVKSFLQCNEICLQQAFSLSIHFLFIYRQL